ncbi:MAG: LacI family DNA-binding transcriptional regulator [Acidimicrobiales bacterium]
MRAPTIYDLAEKAGVSIATVSRALNAKAGLSAETRDRVLAVADELGYVPNGTARGLSYGATETIGVVVATRSTNVALAEEHESLLFVDAVIRGAERSAQRIGYALLLASIRPRSGWEAAKRMVGRTDGLVVVDRAVSEEAMAWLAARHPVVALAWDSPKGAELVVRIDNVEGTRQLVEHLVVHHGYREIGVVRGPESSPDATARWQTVERSAAAFGARIVGTWTGDFSAASGERIARTIRRSGAPLPRVLMCMNDQMAVGVLKVLSAQEIAVPQEVAVTGFDDIIVSRYLSPGLTTVRQPAEELGATAVSSLFEAVRGTHLALREMVLPTELVVRSSCGCSPQPWFDAPHAGVETAGPADTLNGGAHSVAEGASLAELAG